MALNHAVTPDPKQAATVRQQSLHTSRSSKSSTNSLCLGHSNNFAQIRSALGGKGGRGSGHPSTARTRRLHRSPERPADPASHPQPAPFSRGAHCVNDSPVECRLSGSELDGRSLCSGARCGTSQLPPPATVAPAVRTLRGGSAAVTLVPRCSASGFAGDDVDGNPTVNSGGQRSGHRSDHGQVKRPAPVPVSAPVEL